MNSDTSKLKAAARYVEELKAWIREQGQQSNTCTYNILGEICDGCGCPRGKKRREIAEKKS